MKLKILITPLIFIAIVVLLIWYIKPLFDEWASKRAVFTNKQTFAEEIKAKNEKVMAWKSTLSSDAADKNIVLEYVPDEAKEEEIIDNLNSMATDAGVALGDTAVTILSDSTAKDDLMPVTTSTGIDSAVSPDEQITDSKLAENKIQVDLSAFGGYDKLRGFLSKVASFRRFNEVASLEISKDDGSAYSDGSGANLEAGLLTAKISFIFNYAKNNDNLVNSINDSVFGQESLNMSVAKSIEEAKSVTAKDLSVGQFGRANPFIK